MSAGPFHHFPDFLIGRQRLVDSGAGVDAEEGIFEVQACEEGSFKGVRENLVQVNSGLVYCSQVLNWLVVIYSWFLNWQERHVPRQLAGSEDSIL